MAVVPAGTWRVGYEGLEACRGDGEGPVRLIRSTGFLMDRTAVTNEAFGDFVDATGYVTEAEVIGWSFVFHAQLHPAAKRFVLSHATNLPAWWLPVTGARWSAPDGPGSNVDSLADHPVVHVSWNDASAYAAWVGKRLPRESEWEIAARGGLANALYPWGNDLHEGGRHHCNIWQGRFPVENTGEDDYLATAPVTAYAPHGWGLFNMVGNVWEWTADHWSAARPDLKSMRGGSYLCHHDYCNRYRVSARTFNTGDAASCHLGFRCAADFGSLDDRSPSSSRQA